jgi:hypothetical protein
MCFSEMEAVSSSSRSPSTSVARQTGTTSLGPNRKHRRASSVVKRTILVRTTRPRCLGTPLSIPAVICQQTRLRHESYRSVSYAPLSHCGYAAIESLIRSLDADCKPLNLRNYFMHSTQIEHLVIKPDDVVTRLDISTFSL